jgi:hypothetical protein
VLSFFFVLIVGNWNEIKITIWDIDVTGIDRRSRVMWLWIIMWLWIMIKFSCKNEKHKSSCI